MPRFLSALAVCLFALAARAGEIVHHVNVAAVVTGPDNVQAHFLVPPPPANTTDVLLRNVRSAYISRTRLVNYDPDESTYGPVAYQGLAYYGIRHANDGVPGMGSYNTAVWDGHDGQGAAGPILTPFDGYEGGTDSVTFAANRTKTYADQPSGGTDWLWDINDGPNGEHRLYLHLAYWSHETGASVFPGHWLHQYGCRGRVEFDLVYLTADAPSPGGGGLTVSTSDEVAYELTANSWSGLTITFDAFRPSFGTLDAITIGFEEWDIEHTAHYENLTDHLSGYFQVSQRDIGIALRSNDASDVSIGRWDNTLSTESHVCGTFDGLHDWAGSSYATTGLDQSGDLSAVDEFTLDSTYWKDYFTGTGTQTLEIMRVGSRTLTMNEQSQAYYDVMKSGGTVNITYHYH